MSEEIINNIRNIRLDNLESPKSINEISELDSYTDFENLLMNLKSNSLQIIIPDQELINIPNMFLSKLFIKLNNFILFIPFVISLLVGVYGIMTSNYWFLILLLISPIATYSSAFLKGKMYYTILIGLMIICFYFNYIFPGLIFLIIFISSFGARLVRMHRRYILMKLATKNEEIFSFLFFARVLKLIDIKNSKVIFSGMEF